MILTTLLGVVGFFTCLFSLLFGAGWVMFKLQEIYARYTDKQVKEFYNFMDEEDNE